MAGLQDPLAYKDFWHQFNGYFENEDEIEFWDDQIAEWFAIYGVPLKYFPVVVDANKDRVFGEDTTKTYTTVKHLTGWVEGGAYDENLIYNPFGQINQVDFVMYVHRNTFVKVIGRKPLTGDQFTFFQDVTTMTFEVNHLDETTLGQEGNFFGHRGCYVLTCKEREISQALIGEGETHGVTDPQGNLLPNIPEDALVGDGSGRIREKYKVPGVQNIEGTIRGDNDYVQNVADGVDEDGEDFLPKGKGIVCRSGEEKADWGDW